MRVLLVTGGYPPEPCGVGDYTEKLAKELAKNAEINVGVLTGSNPERIRTESSDTELMDSISQWNFTNLIKIINKARSWKPNIIHFQYPSRAFTRPAFSSLLPLIFRLLGHTVVQTWHEPQSIEFNHRIKSFFYFQALRLGATGLIFVRPNYMNLLTEYLVRAIKSIPNVVIPNASPLPASFLNTRDRELLRSKYLGSQRRLVVFFGFINPNKGIHLLFDIADPSVDSLVIIGMSSDDNYVQLLTKISKLRKWSDEHLHWTGHIPAQDAADLMAVADAVVLPFTDGGGEWNTSIHGALAQGTLVITTSATPIGDDPSKNLYTAEPLNIDEMRAALNRLGGRKINSISPKNQWIEIANAHLVFYKKMLEKNNT